MQIQMTNKAFNGVEGYTLTTTETIVSLIAKGILEGHHIYAVTLEGRKHLHFQNLKTGGGEGVE